MASINWPTTLPPLSRKFSTNVGYRNIRQTMDSNRVRQYPQFTTGIDRAKVEWDMTPEQLQIFKDFYDTTLGQGVEYFNLDIPNPDGTTLTTTDVRFLGGYKEQIMSYDKRMVSADLEYLTASILAPGSFTLTTNADGTVDWPESLLGFPSSMRVDYDPATVTSNIDNGRLFRRKRYTQRTEQFQVTFDFNQSQYAIFRYFFQESLKLGNDWFEMRLPYHNTLNDYADSKVRFASDYSVSYVSIDNWDVKVTLEVEIPEAFYVIDYKKGIAESGTVPDNQLKTKGIDLILQNNVGGLGGAIFEFIGWNTTADASGTRYLEAENFTTDANISLYPEFRINDTFGSYKATNASRHRIINTGCTTLNGSCLFDSLTDKLTIPNSSDFNFGADPFEIQVLLTFSNTANSGFIIGNQTGSTGWKIEFDSVAQKFTATVDTTTVTESTVVVSNVEYLITFSRFSVGLPTYFSISSVGSPISYLTFAPFSISNSSADLVIGGNILASIHSVSVRTLLGGRFYENMFLNPDFSAPNGSSRIIDSAKPNYAITANDNFIFTDFDSRKWTKSGSGTISVFNSQLQIIVSNTASGASEATQDVDISGDFTISVDYSQSGSGVNELESALIMYSGANYFAIQMRLDNSTIEVWNNGSFQGSFGGYSASGTLEIQRTGTSIVYKLDDITIASNTFSGTIDRIGLSGFSSSIGTNSLTTLFDNFTAVDGSNNNILSQTEKGATFAVLSDASINFKDVQQLTASRQPIYNALTSSVECTGDNMDLGSKLITTGSFSAYCAIIPDTIHNGYIWSQGTAGTSVQTGLRFKSNGKIAIVLSGTEYESTNSYSAGIGYYISFIFNNTNSAKVYVNGVLWINQSSVSDSYTGNEFRLFSSVDATTTDFDGSMREISIRSVLDNDTTRQSIESYMQALLT